MASLSFRFNPLIYAGNEPEMKLERSAAKTNRRKGEICKRTSGEDRLPTSNRICPYDLNIILRRQHNW